MDSGTVRRRWANRSGAYSPAYYAYHGPDGTSEAIRRILDRLVEPAAPVLEIGCSAGRHLAHLHENGYERLAGVDLNDDAFDVMAEAYPDLARDGMFYRDAVERVVPQLRDGRFEAVYSVETLQHVHPDETWVFEDLARVTDDLLVTAEVECGSEPGAGAGTATDAEDGADERRAAAATGADATDPPVEPPDVNYVDDGLPLYYRDWHRVFTDLGLVEVDSRTGVRTTVRAFRHDRE